MLIQEINELLKLHVTAATSLLFIVLGLYKLLKHFICVKTRNIKKKKETWFTPVYMVVAQLSHLKGWFTCPVGG